MNQQGTLLPKRQIHKNTCTHTYRHWDCNQNQFDYQHATCSYVGARYFNAAGQATSDRLDVCGKRLSDCKARFKNSPLPTRAFPEATDTQG